jgi:hypothetical protein
MIKINLGKGYRISLDKNCFVLWKFSKVMGKFANLDSLIDCFIRNCLWSSAKVIVELDQLSLEIKYLKNTIVDIYKKEFTIQFQETLVHENA